MGLPDGDGHQQDRRAVAAGCTVVIKPAEQTPLSVLALAEIMKEAGPLDRVLNLMAMSEPAGVMEPVIRDGRPASPCSPVVDQVDAVRPDRRLLEGTQSS